MDKRASQTHKKAGHGRAAVKATGATNKTTAAKVSRGAVKIKAGAAFKAHAPPISAQKQVETRQARSFKLVPPIVLFRSSELMRIEMIREGVPAIFIDYIARQMNISRDLVCETLKLPRSTVKRKILNSEALSAEHSERVIGLERLAGQVEEIVSQSGNPDGFDANKWIGEWIKHPLTALGGASPAEFMDTMEGQKLVSRILAQAQSGAYA